MAETHCPICHEPLEVRDVAPCYDCGADPTELDHLAAGRHTYAEFEVLGANAVLCDFCRADFSSYDPTYFGRPPRTRPERNMRFVREVRNPQPAKDKFCAHCNRRLAFLRFLRQARATAVEGRTE